MSFSTSSIIEIGSIIESNFQKILTTEYAQSKKVILVDENTHDECLEYLITSFPDELTDAEVMLLPAGEENKVMEVCFQIWEALSEYKIGRKDVIINLGGGVITDLGGFIASIYKRGVDVINIPTSYLGMVDASIGGKVGIDLGTLKNQLGSFYWPKQIFIDPIFLQTLPDEEKINGIAEALKAGAIADKEIWDKMKSFDEVEQFFELDILKKIVNIKTEIVSQDPLEVNIRKTLNFGHTVGHAIEGYLLERDPLKHGYAIAIGMVVEAYIATSMNLMTTEDYQEIMQTICKWFAPIEFEAHEFDALIELMRHDKKNYNGEIKMALVTEIGTCQHDVTIPEEVIRKALQLLILS